MWRIEREREGRARGSSLHSVAEAMPECAVIGQRGGVTSRADRSIGGDTWEVSPQEEKTSRRCVVGVGRPSCISGFSSPKWGAFPQVLNDLARWSRDPGVENRRRSGSP